MVDFLIAGPSLAAPGRNLLGRAEENRSQRGTDEGTAMARSDWGIGLVGLGNIAQHHLSAYRAQGLHVVAGAEPDEARRTRTGEKFGLPTDADYRELIDRPEVRIVDVATPPWMEVREPIVRYAAERGKALFMQKPLMPNLPEARRLVEIAEVNGVPMMVNQNSLFVPAFLALEPYLRDPQYLGRPYYMQIENRSWVDTSEHPWFGKAERFITSDMAIHHFALVRHWFGDVQHVHAMLGRDASQTGMAGDNLSVVSLRLESGVQGLIINNWTYRGDRALHHLREEIIIQGDRGCVSGDTGELRITALDPTPRTIVPQYTGTWFPDAFGHSMAHFVDSLDAGRPFLCSGRDNLKTLAVVEAAYRSAAEGRVVAIDDVMM
jgi:predicted dehydrogenase